MTWVVEVNGVCGLFDTQAEADTFAATAVAAGHAAEVEEWVSTALDAMTPEAIRLEQKMAKREAQRYEKRLREQRAKQRKEDAERRLLFMRAKRALREAGVLIDIDACGCCNSPVVTLTVNGVRLLDDETEANMRMHPHST